MKRFLKGSNDQANLAVALFEGIEQVLKFTIEVFKERKPNPLTVILQWHKLHLIWQLSNGKTNIEHMATQLFECTKAFTIQPVDVHTS